MANAIPMSRPLRRHFGMSYYPMSDFPVESVENGDMAAVMENFQKKNSLGSRQQVVSSAAQQQQQQLLANTSTTSSSSSRVAKTSCSSSQRVHHVTSSEMKASSMKSDLSELKSSISEMKNLSSAATAMNFSSRLRSSMEELDREDTGGGGDASDAQDISEPLVTFPDPDTPPPVTGAVSLVSPNLVTSMGTNGVAVSSAASIATASSSSSSSSETVKYEQKRVTSASKTKVVTDGFSSEQATANSSEMKMVQAGEMSYQEQSAAAAMRARLEVDGVSAEKSVAMKQQGGGGRCKEEFGEKGRFRRRRASLGSISRRRIRGPPSWRHPDSRVLVVRPARAPGPTPVPPHPTPFSIFDPSADFWKS
uniref:Uncharacterized protein n=1 Tax=Timema monikensis TaxID=170555 RepID=A0A7R9HM96_9NEOP|nr:unnamed protein product [Timema monikensis]